MRYLTAGIFAITVVSAQPAEKRLRLPGPPGAGTAEWVAKQLGWHHGPSETGIPDESRITFWHLDDDSYREAVLVWRQPPMTTFLILDQDRDGWWFVGHEWFENYTPPGFPVGNWPDSRGPRCVVADGTWGHGSDFHSHGIHVLRIIEGRLVRVLSATTYEYQGLPDGEAARLVYSRGFVEVWPGRILACLRRITSHRPALPSASRFERHR